mgnify:CR=1 FL=1
MNDADEWRTELAEWAERMTAARGKYREREAAERVKQRGQWRRPADSIHYAGIPASVERGYRRESEETDV